MQTAHQLINDGADRSLVGNHAFNAFRNELGDVALVVVLEVAVSGAVAHSAEGTHAAVRLEGAALGEDHFARSFISTGEHGTHHHGVSAGSESLGDITGEADAAVSDQRNAGAFESFCHIGNSGNLRDANTGNDTRRADGARADTDLDSVSAVVDESLGSVTGSDVAADHLNVRVVLLNPVDAVQHALGVAVSGINAEDVNAGFNQRFDTLFSAGTDGNGSAAEELAGGVVSGVRKFSSLDDIADRHQAGELELIVNDQNALETMLVHQSLGFFEGGALLHNDEAFAGGHDGGNRHILAVFEADVAVRHHAENRAVFSDNRETGDAAHTGETKHVSNRHIRTDGDRIIHDTGFETLHLADFSCLGLSGHILVNNADATLFSESNSETGFSNRIHGCRNERNVERDFARQLGFQGSLSGKHIGVRRNEKNVIERECSLKESHG